MSIEIMLLLLMLAVFFAVCALAQTAGQAVPCGHERSLWQWLAARLHCASRRRDVRLLDVSLVLITPWFHEGHRKIAF
jgi:hypothetical protein